MDVADRVRLHERLAELDQDIGHAPRPRAASRARARHRGSRPRAAPSRGRAGHPGVRPKIVDLHDVLVVDLGHRGPPRGGTARYREVHRATSSVCSTLSATLAPQGHVPRRGRSCRSRPGQAGSWTMKRSPSTLPIKGSIARSITAIAQAWAGRSSGRNSAVSVYACWQPAQVIVAVMFMKTAWSLGRTDDRGADPSAGPGPPPVAKRSVYDFVFFERVSELGFADSGPY